MTDPRTLAATGPITGGGLRSLACRRRRLLVRVRRQRSSRSAAARTPETHYCWRALIPTLAESHTVIARFDQLPRVNVYGTLARLAKEDDLVHFCLPGPQRR
jgi:hypothetical protein